MALNLIALILRSGAARFHADTGRRSLEQNVAAEAKELGRAAARFRADIARRLDETAIFHQPAEVLFVQMMPGDGFDRLLQFEQSEGFGHHFKHHGAVFEFAA